MTESGSEPDRGLFAYRLEQLFATVTDPTTGKRYTDDDVAAAIRASGGEVSSSYLWKLRRGTARNPTLQHINALAGFFHVPAAYFVEDELAQTILAELKLLTAMRKSGVRDVALRAGELSPEGLDAIRTVIEQIARLDRHTDPGADPNTDGPQA